ncbi:helix-turn-helix domain-containing protein [Alcaligenes parafaecalis]|uniref:Helix-turn-helix transcriptional regulator n=1 Tax=Alcaligenes parafaecalis TaxID=171260 RepID=A0ABT3VQM3_9BURK|nr:helix-turn-helix transcriptional regulator [Alcaligenes parafaecalis]MCX5464441.1 helix-turn-helix transcriptional regulator [Alcaligenes parafaecalis]
MTSPLVQNLRHISDQSGSVAELCRQVGINRQQFNKYLAGTHTPSRQNLSKIARYQAISIEDLSLPPVQFLKRLHGDSRAEEPVGLAHFQTLATLARQSVTQLQPFLGTYLRYHRSSIYLNSIVRAVSILYQQEGLVRYITLESMAVPDDSGNVDRYHFTYRGVCYFLGNRLFLCDYERRQRNEITNTILMPQFRTPIKYMYGLLSGIASTAYGQPYAARAVFQKLGESQQARRAILRQAALISPDDNSIPAAIKAYLCQTPNLLAEV